MNILFEDRDIIVCIKEIGVLSEEATAENMPDLIRQHLNKPDAYIGVVHRLDTAVGGVMVYAKTKSAAARLSRQIQNGCFTKQYLAVIEGAPDKPVGTYNDLLFKDSSKNKVFVVKSERKGVKKAVLDYEVLQTATFEEKSISLLKIKLKTGRSHQIRVQFASRKMPLLGDGKYGNRHKCCIALFSSDIEFLHPITQSQMNFSALPQDKFPFNNFDIKK